MLELETGILLNANTNAYLENVLRMPTLPPHRVPLATFTAATIHGTFGGCEAYRVLIFRSLFGAFSHEPGAPSPEGWFVEGWPGLSWLDTKERHPPNLPICDTCAASAVASRCARTSSAVAGDARTANTGTSCRENCFQVGGLALGG